MTAISCPFPGRRCETSASSLKEPSAFNPSGTSFWTSLQCVSATRTTHFVYATCYLCLGHVCYLCLGLGPEPRPTKVGYPFFAFFAFFRGYSSSRLSNRAIVSSYDVVENQRRQAAVPAELSRTIVLGRGGSVLLGGFCRQLKQTVLPIRS
jgi:hypothetical protein